MVCVCRHHTSGIVAHVPALACLFEVATIITNKNNKKPQRLHKVTSTTTIMTKTTTTSLLLRSPVLQSKLRPSSFTCTAMTINRSKFGNTSNRLMSSGRVDVDVGSNDNNIISGNSISSLTSFSPSLPEIVSESFKLGVSTCINTMLKRQMEKQKQQLLQQEQVVSSASDSNGDVVYSKQVLRMYDSLVWKFNAPYLWGMNAQEIHKLYNENLVQPNNSRRHAEVGVGTGKFLLDANLYNKPRHSEAHPNKSSSQQLHHITLLDSNQSSLNICQQSLMEQEAQHCGANFNGTTSIDIKSRMIDVQKPIEDQENFSSLGEHDTVGANFLFHCLQGNSLMDKEIAFYNCGKLLTRNDGVMFGSTILGKDLITDKHNASAAAIQTHETYNQLGIFSNEGDSYNDLSDILHETFTNVKLWKVGYCGVWKVSGHKGR